MERRQNCRSLLLQVFTVVCLCVSIASGQVSNPVIAAQAPISGSDHHYIGIGAETVNPADGSLSFDLPIQPPTGRQLSIPFGIRYFASDQFHVQGDTVAQAIDWAANLTTPSQIAGWNYKLPGYTALGNKRQDGFYQPPPPQQTIYYYCDYTNNYVFRGFDGVNRNLKLYAQWPDAQSPSQSCTKTGPYNGGGHGWQAWSPNIPYSCNPYLNVTDPSGTVYEFDSPLCNSPSPGFPPVPWGELAHTITDKNGNQISLASGGKGYVDTLGRSIFSWSGLGTNGDTITVSGLTGNVVLHWGTTSVTFPEHAHEASSSNPGVCNSIRPISGASIKAVSEIDLPNGQKYTFTYSTTYGLISRITFPGGGYVRYVWGLNPLSASGYALYGNVAQAQQNACYFTYDTPAIVDRYVSYDGSTEVLHQHFIYSTTWSSSTGYYWISKSTTVTSTDLLTGQSTQTAYTYLPMAPDLGGNLQLAYSPSSGRAERSLSGRKWEHAQDGQQDLEKLPGNHWGTNNPR